MKQALFFLAPLVTVGAMVYGCGSSSSSSAAGSGGMKTTTTTTSTSSKASSTSSTGTSSPTSSVVASSTTGPTSTGVGGGGGGNGGAGGGGGMAECDPVVGCGMGGECDINDNGDGFTCFQPGASDGAICAACDEQMTFCQDGMTCLVSAMQCAKFCCDDGDCGAGATCDMTQLTTEGVTNTHGVGLCVASADGGAVGADCNAPATSPSMGSCYMP